MKIRSVLLFFTCVFVASLALAETNREANLKQLCRSEGEMASNYAVARDSGTTEKEIVEMEKGAGTKGKDLANAKEVISYVFKTKATKAQAYEKFERKCLSRVGLK